jgi:4-amino-4-deoxy-L-arabinose transferase-like glycosyltransferase
MKVNKGPISKPILIVPLLSALVVKVVVIFSNALPFNSDEAIVALMAKHIIQGQVPNFFYGQSYMGSLDAMLISIAFRIFGEQIWPIRMIQSLLFLGTVLTTMLIARKLFGSNRSALIAGFLIALPPVNVTLYTTVSLGGYGEALLLGNLLFLGGVSLIEQTRDETVRQDNIYLNVFLWSLGAGFAFWVFGLSIVFTLPVIIIMFWYIYKNYSYRKTIIIFLIFTVGLLIGAIPWWMPSLSNENLNIMQELLGSAITGANQGYPLLKPLSRLLSLVLFGGTVMTGMRPPWGVAWLMLPLLPFILIFWLVIMLHSVRSISKNNDNVGLLALSLVVVVLTFGFIFSPFGDDPSGRYFLPLIVPMAVFGAAAIEELLGKYKYGIAAGVLLIVIYNLGGTYQSIKKNPPGLTTQFDQITQVDHHYMDELIDFLSEKDIKYGYTNYWVSYPLAFRSNEDLIFIPRLPYHEDFRYTSRDDRYSTYTDRVERAENVGYITTNHEDLNERLRGDFKESGISWQEERIGDYQIFFNLSETIRPNDLGLGKTTKP